MFNIDYWLDRIWNHWGYKPQGISGREFLDWASRNGKTHFKWRWHIPWADLNQMEKESWALLLLRFCFLTVDTVCDQLLYMPVATAST